MPSQLTVLESTWPLIVITFPRIVDADAVHAMMDAYDRALARGSKFASILDGTHIARLPDAEARQTLVSWMGSEARQEQERSLSVAAAVVVPSGLVRAFVAAIYFVRRPHSPQKWTEALPEGVEWTCAELARAGVALTPEIEKLRAEMRRPEAI